MKKLNTILFTMLFMSGLCFAQDPVITVQLVESIGVNGNCSNVSDCEAENGCFSIQLSVDQAGWSLASYNIQVQYNWNGMAFPANFNAPNSADYLSDFPCFIPDGSDNLAPDTSFQQFRVSGAGGALTDALTPGVFTPVHEVCFEWFSVNPPGGGNGAVFDDVNGQEICVGGTGQFGFLSPVTLIRPAAGGGTESFNEPNVSPSCLTLDNTTFTCLQNPLPIELTTFTGVKIEEKVKLDWKTETEIDNDFFEVQRSINGTNFEVIGQVDGAGTSFNTEEYRYWDESLPNSEIIYYRLRQVDFDGRFSYTNVVAILNDKISDEISVYPNPASTEVTISGTTINQIRLYASDGKLIMAELNISPSNSKQLDVSELPKGYYLVRINDNEIVELIIE